MVPCSFDQGFGEEKKSKILMTTNFPDDLKCPISLEIMSDPVILPSGHSFDRPNIQRWLDAGHRTCPLTKLPLPEHPSLIPNHSLRSLISHFTLPSQTPPRQHHRNRLQSQSQPPQTLESTLASPSASVDSKLDSLNRLSSLYKTDVSFRAKLTDSGAVSAVLKCVGSDEPRLQEKALNLLLELSLDDNNKVGLVVEGALDRVVTALRGTTPSCRAVAATVLTSLAVVEVNKASIGANRHAIPALVSLLRDGSSSKEKREAATALYTLCSFPENRWRVVECGAVSILLRLAESGLDRAVDILGQLAKSKQGREYMERLNGCVRSLVRILVRVLGSSSPRVQHALLTLSSLCQFSDKMRAEASDEGVVEICTRLAEHQNEKIRENACYLIQVLNGNHSMI